MRVHGLELLGFKVSGGVRNHRALKKRPSDLACLGSFRRSVAGIRVHGALTHTHTQKRI